MVDRKECKECNHVPVCREDLKQNTQGTCPFYEPDEKKDT